MISPARGSLRTGFTEAEGCFSVVIFKSKTSKLGEAIKLSFNLTQHTRDEYLIKSLIKYFLRTDKLRR